MIEALLERIGVKHIEGKVTDIWDSSDPECQIITVLDNDNPRTLALINQDAPSRVGEQFSWTNLPFPLDVVHGFVDLTPTE